MPELSLSFSADLTAADTESRTITGRIVPFGEVGNTSIGPVVFEAASIHIPETVHLLMEHDQRAPLGRMIDHSANPAGITATFAVARTTRGTDALIEAADGLRPGLSVGVEVHAHTVAKDGTIHVTAATLNETSLVTRPAFSTAQVEKVAASEPDDAPEAETQTETQGETVSDDMNPEVEAAEVEASAPAPAPIYAAPRLKPLTAGEYLGLQVAAARGDHDARIAITAADDSTATNTGLTLAPHMAEFVSTTINGRGTIDAMSQGALPATGLTFTIPYLTTAPTVGIVAEEGATAGTGMTSAYKTVTVKKFAGSQQVSWELIDRSGPEFLTELVRELGNAYAKATDVHAIDVLDSDGTASTGVTADAAGLQSFMATESAAAYAGTGNFASNLVVSAGVWAAIMGFVDGNDRPLYNAAVPSNASGSVSGRSVRGTVLGADLYVDAFINKVGMVDDSAFLLAPEAATWYESGSRQVQVQMIGTGQLEIAVYGYGAAVVKKADGVRRLNIT